MSLLTSSYTILCFLCRNQNFDFDSTTKASDLPTNISTIICSNISIDKYIEHRQFMTQHDPHLRFFTQYLVSIIPEIFEDYNKRTMQT